MLALRRIDGYNFNKIIALQVTEEQRDYVASNVFSLAEAYAMPECTPLGVYNGMEPIGFVMYALDAEDNEYWIYRLMIDAKYQHMGYGREALRLTIAEIRRIAPEKKVLYISFEPDNAVAKHLYGSFGFEPDGRTVDGETVYRLAL